MTNLDNQVTATPLVSIGMPLYNGAAFVAETLDSVLNQSYQNIEIIIRDNDSTDNSKEIVKGYLARDQRIRFSSAKTNEGAAKNYNAVFAQATGQYFKWAAADDLLDPTFVEKCVEVLETSPSTVLAYPQSIIIDASGAQVKHLDDRLDADGDDPQARYLAVHTQLRECNAVFGVIRREALAKTSLIQPYQSADAHLLAELTLYGRFQEIPERLFFRRDHEEASSSDKSRAAQAAFYDPRQVGRPLMFNWAGLWNDFKGIVRAPQTIYVRAKLIAFLCRTVWWQKHGFLQELINYCKYLMRGLWFRRS